MAGCASTPPPNYVPVVTAISFPDLGTEITRSVGEDMLRQGFYSETDGVEIAQENKIGPYRLSQGFYSQISEDEKHTYHTFDVRKGPDGEGYIVQARDLIGMPMPYPQSVRFSKSEQETCLVIGGINGVSCDSEYPFTRTRKDALSDRDLQQTLIYSGRVGDRIKIGYRESSGRMARSAFSNEAEYDLSLSDEIAYRGARIQVLEADNQKIRYVVISNFNTQ